MENNLIFEYIRRQRQLNPHVNFDRIRLESIKKNRIILGPSSLHINIACPCNYKCVFCVYLTPLKAKNEEECEVTPSARVIRYINEAHSMGTESIIISAESGDPLMHPDIKKIIRAVFEKKMKLMIQTNGALASRVFEPFLPNKDLFLVVNLSAANPKMYQRIHGASAAFFREHINGLKRVNSLCNVRMKLLIFNENFKSIEQYFKMAADIGIKDILIKYPTLYYNEQNIFSLSTGEKKELMARLGALRNFVKKHGIRTNIDEFRRGITPGYNPSRAPGTRLRPCFNLWFNCMVNPKGDLYICCLDTGYLGNIEKGSLKDVYFSEETLKLALKARRGFDTRLRKWHKCLRCEHVLINEMARGYSNARSKTYVSQ